MLHLIEAQVNPFTGLLVVLVLLATLVGLVYGATLATAGAVFVIALVAALGVYYLAVRLDAYLGGQARRGY